MATAKSTPGGKRAVLEDGNPRLTRWRGMKLGMIANRMDSIRELFKKLGPIEKTRGCYVTRT